MGLFNAHAVAQQRADRIATLLQSFADGQLDTAVGEARRPATSVSTTACERCSGNCANNAPNSSRWKAWRRGWRR
ncbi:hypothetical protein [Pseudomonas aeruginosa]|uniref:hypothetical protein n=1 Tax=Pseudomonas aeruginosa TaxID=287 RepID=UPI003D76A420